MNNDIVERSINGSEISSITVSSRTESMINDIRTSTKKRRRGVYHNIVLDGADPTARRRKRGGGSPHSSEGMLPRPERGSIGGGSTIGSYTRGRTTASTTPQDLARTGQDQVDQLPRAANLERLPHFGAAQNREPNTDIDTFRTSIVPDAVVPANLERLPHFGAAEKRDWWVGFRTSTVPDAVVPFPGLESARPSVERGLESARPSMERGSGSADDSRRTRGSIDEIILDLECGEDLHAVSGADRGNSGDGIV